MPLQRVSSDDLRVSGGCLLPNQSGHQDLKSRFEARRLACLETLIQAASGEPIVPVGWAVAEVAAVRAADVALAQRTRGTRADRRGSQCQGDVLSLALHVP